MRISLIRMFRIAPDRQMSCPEVGKLLQRYLDGHLDDTIAAGISTHLEDCRRCGLEADTYQRIKRTLGDLQRPLPPDVLARLREFGKQIAPTDPTDKR